jgi:hypothetical protein
MIGKVTNTVPKISSIKESILSGQVSNKIPELDSVKEKVIKLGSVETKTPKMYSVVND